MLEDALRDAFAAKAATAPPGSLDGVADAAIRGAGRIRRRRRVIATGFTGIVAIAVAVVAALQVISPARPVRPQPDYDVAVPPRTVDAPTDPATLTPPAQTVREVDAIGGTAQTAKRVRLQLPDKGTVAAAYQAKDGYLVVNTQPDGDKQLVLQDDDNKQQVLVEEASNIAVDKDGGRVAWAAEGQMNVASRKGDDKKLTKSATAPMPETAVPVTFVGQDLVVGREDGGGFDVWYPNRDYTESWDPTVVRVFGANPDGKSLYAEVKPANKDEPMCLAQLVLDQPFKVKDRLCGLPLAAQGGSRVSPDGHWLAYPVDGLKQVALLDLTTVFSGGKPKLFDLHVTVKTVWLNATTFVVDNGSKFQALTPPDGKIETLDVASDDTVLIEPLYAG